MQEFTRLFKALSDPNRLIILKILERKPLCVCEITELLDLAVSTVSKHLSILREAGLISDEKDGKWVIYRLNEQFRAGFVPILLKELSERLEQEEKVKMALKKADNINRYMACKNL